jgi:hypothetical protein
MNVFTSYIQLLRENPVFADELSDLLMESVGACASERDLQLLGENKIIACAFPVHTANLFQALGFLFWYHENNKDLFANEPEVASVYGQFCVLFENMTKLRHRP